MGNRATAIRVVIGTWLILAVAGDIGLVLAPMPPGQASNAASDESFVILLLAVIAWPVFSAVLAALYFTLVVNHRTPPQGEVSAAELRGIPTLSAALPKPTSTDQPLEVQVIAQQWWFTYRYPSYGGIETAQLVLPVNQKIQFHITSLDVTHSFWFYALGVKADAVPLNDNVFTATPTQTGTYRVQCAELCGLWHGNMADNTAMVVSSSDFATWIQQQTALDAPVMKFLPPYSHTYLAQPPVYAG